MYAVYYKKLNIVFWITKSQPYRHQRSQCTWEMTTNLPRKVAAVFWSLRVLPSGPKLQDINCTDTFL